MSPFATGSSAVHSIRVGWMFKMETLGDMPNGLLHYYIIHDLSDSEESLVSLTVRSLTSICSSLTSTMFSEPILRQSHTARQRQINDNE